MATKPFASSADTEPKAQTLDILADGVYALTAEGDPNVGAVEGEDFVVCIEALATPVAARKWLSTLRRHCDKPIKFLVLSHYHAVRVLGASAFDAQVIVAHDMTRELILERGKQDWDSEFQRMPRLFDQPESIPGLTHPTVTFSESFTIDLGGDRGQLILKYLGRGHTAGDIVAWLPKHKILFAGDLVEAQAALYTGDAFHKDWSTLTLDNVAELQAEQLVGGRGAVAKGQSAVDRAIEQSRDFIRALLEEVGKVHSQKGTLKEAFIACHGRLAPKYGSWPIFEHTLPFDVKRVWDELSGKDWPEIWTAEKDREVWDQLQDEVK